MVKTLEMRSRSGMSLLTLPPGNHASKLFIDSYISCLAITRLHLLVMNMGCAWPNPRL